MHGGTEPPQGYYVMQFVRWLGTLPSHRSPSHVRSHVHLHLAFSNSVPLSPFSFDCQTTPVFAVVVAFCWPAPVTGALPFPPRLYELVHALGWVGTYPETRGCGRAGFVAAEFSNCYNVCKSSTVASSLWGSAWECLPGAATGGKPGCLSHSAHLVPSRSTRDWTTCCPNTQKFAPFRQ